tara:strand:+ start:606 stop:1091 length:486 start_codon:yes stop_codon:yes gene_type:complete
MKKLIILGVFTLAGCVSTEPPKDAHIVQKVNEQHDVISYDKYSDAIYRKDDDTVTIVDGNEKETFKWVANGNLEQQENTGYVRFHMKKGLLMPQLKELAGHLPKVSVGEGWWQWKASTNYEWPNDVTLEAQSVSKLFLSMSKAYKLTTVITGNGVVHVHDK